MTGRTDSPDATDQATNNPTIAIPTDTPAAEHVTAEHVTVGEIAEFLRQLTALRVSGRNDPGQLDALHAHKTELFARIAANPATPTSSLDPMSRAMPERDIP